jgi:hypothetical protein
MRQRRLEQQVSELLGTRSPTSATRSAVQSQRWAAPPSSAAAKSDQEGADTGNVADFVAQMRALSAQQKELRAEAQPEGRTYAGNGGRSVYAAEFPSDVTKSQVKHLFQQYGMVTDLHWKPHDRDDRGYYFINFATSAAAFAATELDGTPWAPDGMQETHLLVNQRPPQVSVVTFDTTAGAMGLTYGTDIGTGNVVVTAVDADTQADAEKVLLKSVILSVNGREIDDTHSLVEAVEDAKRDDPSAVEFEFQEVEGCHLRDNGGRSIFVGSIPDPDATDSDIRALFPASIGLTDKGDYFFVHFQTSEQAQSAVIRGATMLSPSTGVQAPLKLEQKAGRSPQAPAGREQVEYKWGICQSRLYAQKTCNCGGTKAHCEKELHLGWKSDTCDYHRNGRCNERASECKYAHGDGERARLIDRASKVCKGAGIPWE